MKWSNGKGGNELAFFVLVCAGVVLLKINGGLVLNQKCDEMMTYPCSIHIWGNEKRSREIRDIVIPRSLKGWGIKNGTSNSAV